ncbi:MAG: acylglycerol kinase family protein, partial [Clostridia bacterium]|nr:acylglycerol kinase family protein [Clostridia bacterium]
MLDLIVNPIAGGKNGKRMEKNLALIEARLKERNVNYSVFRSEKKGDMKSIAEKLVNDGATDIVCVGGDGSLHEVINGITEFDKVNLGLVPCGTGNDFAKTLKLPFDPVKAIDLIIDGEPKYTDYLQLPTVRCINIAGFGIDVEVL